MAAADTAKLVASLILDAKGFSKGISKADKDLGKLESTAFRVGQNIGSGTKAAIGNIAKIGVVAAGAITVAVAQGLRDLATLETAITSVDGAIEQFGLSGQVSGKQVAEWANDIEANVQAAFDDKDITAAAATLIRFGKVTPKALKQALIVTTDLAAKTGDVDSAATLLAKSLADPAKAAGKLAKQGIILTKAQQDTIKAMLEQNDVAGAQQVILDSVAKTTSGAAVASQGKYADAINILNDAAEDAKKALAEGFLPVIEKVASRLSKAVGDPKFIASLREFGVSLAGGLDKLIDVAAKLPWSTIGQSLQLAGTGAKAVLDAFVALPPWVQTAVLTGWGLNKLTGGALSGIVGELGKGLIKGVLGINAGVVNIKAATVAGAGGAGAIGGAASGPGKLARVASAVGKVFIVGAAAAFIAELVDIRGQQSAENKGAIADLATLGTAFGKTATLQQMRDSLKGLEGYQQTLTNSLTPEAIAYQLNIDGVRDAIEKQAADLKAGIAAAEKISGAFGGLSQDERDQKNTLNKVLSEVHNSSVQDTAISTKNQQAAFAIRDAVNTKVPLLGTIIAGVKTAVDATKLAAAHAGQQTAAAIRDKDLSVANYNTVSISNRVSVQETIKTQTTFKQYSKFIS